MGDRSIKLSCKTQHKSCEPWLALWHAVKALTNNPPYINPLLPKHVHIAMAAWMTLQPTKASHTRLRAGMPTPSVLKIFLAAPVETTPAPVSLSERYPVGRRKTAMLM